VLIVLKKMALTSSGPESESLSDSNLFFVLGMFQQLQKYELKAYVKNQNEKRLKWHYNMQYIG
jgi:hypothetical protein